MALTDCRVCATPLPADARFCMACGVDVTDPGAATQQVRPRDQMAELQDRLARTLSGRYQVRSLLGAGGMAAVFLADEIGLDRPVAIKVLPPELSRDEGLVQRFQREAKTAAKLDHPHIIPIHRVESEAGLHYFVMKYVQGSSLESLLDAKDPIPIDRAITLLREAATALGHAHARGVVHRDVKPANIMLDQDGRVVLTDFGISKAGESSQLTQTGMIIGTPHYMAPEQALGVEVDGRADQYALGVVAYEMLARQCPFTGDSAHTIIYRHIHEPPKPIATLRPDVPPHLAQAVAVALAKDPNDRFATMEDLARALGGDASVLAGRPIRSASASAAGQPTPSRVRTVQMSAAQLSGSTDARRGMRSATLAVIGAAAVLVIGVGGWLVLGQRTDAAAGDRPGVADAGATGPSGGAPSLAVSDGGRPRDTSAVASAPTGAPAAVPPADTAPPVTATDARQQNRPGTSSPRATSPRRTEPPPRAPERPQTAPLTVASEPYGVLYIDDVEIGDTPVANHQLEVGRSYRIRVEREGFRSKRETITVNGPNPIRRNYVLDPGGAA